MKLSKETKEFWSGQGKTKWFKKNKYFELLTLFGVYFSVQELSLSEASEDEPTLLWFEWAKLVCIYITCQQRQWMDNNN